MRFLQLQTSVALFSFILETLSFILTVDNDSGLYIVVNIIDLDPATIII